MRRPPVRAVLHDQEQRHGPGAGDRRAHRRGPRRRASLSPNCPEGGAAFTLRHSRSRTQRWSKPHEHDASPRRSARLGRGQPAGRSAAAQSPSAGPRHRPYPDLTGRVLVVDDNPRARQSMADVLASSRPRSARLRQRHRGPQAAPTGSPSTSSSPTCKCRAWTAWRSSARWPSGKIEAQVVMVTAFASVASAVEAMRYGAFDYIEKPFDVEQLEAARRPGPAARREGRPALEHAVAAARLGRDDGRRQPGDAAAAAADRPGRADRRNRADHRRKRHRQGAGRPLPARRQPPSRAGPGRA